VLFGHEITGLAAGDHGVWILGWMYRF
jgi:hypothetical protein